MAAEKEDAVVSQSPWLLTTVIEINNSIRKEKFERAMAFMSGIKQVTNEEEDKYANDLLVAVRERVTELETLRKKYSRPLDAWMSEQISIENQLKAEAERIRKYRNDYANDLDKQAKAKQKLIDDKKKFDQHEADVKGRLKISVEVSVSKRLVALESAVSEILNRMTLESVESEKQKLNIKPVLKKEFFDSLFVVEYDKTIFTPEQFKALQDRAKGYWTYERINEEYVKKANEIIQKWVDQVPFRVKELEKIAAGDATAKAAADKRIEDDQKELRANATKQEQQIVTSAQAQVQDESLRADFAAQVQTQDIETVRAQTRRKYRIDTTKDSNLMEVSAIVSKMIINLIAENDFKSIYKMDKEGKVKLDADGDVVYVDGVQYWLDQMAKISIPVKIPGLVCTEYKVTKATKK